jgi:hypothetical protein
MVSDRAITNSPNAECPSWLEAKLAFRVAYCALGDGAGNFRSC